MARIFITGSSDGLGLLAAQHLLAEGHTVVAHARDAARAAHTREQLPTAETVLTGDFASLAQTKQLADAANQSGPFDAVIHNAAIGYKERARTLTEDGLPHVFQINTLAPYMLTALMHPPKRLVYVSSELHRRGDATLDDLLWERKPWNGTRAYSDTKLHNIFLAFAFARLWPNTLANAMEPGWVPTKMGGPNASDDLDAGSRTQVWLAAGNAPEATVTGAYFYHLAQKKPLAATHDPALQDKLLTACAQLSGTPIPTPPPA